MYSAVKRVVPKWVKIGLKQFVNGYRLHRGLREFKRLKLHEPVPVDLLKNIVAAWGNSWSAQYEYLEAILNDLPNSEGAILECGSGLSTILMGLRCRETSRTITALEHNSTWANRVRGITQYYDLKHVAVVETTIQCFGPYSWYDPTPLSVPGSYMTVICDGPPGDTLGGRYGLLPIMEKRLADRCKVFFDDAGRDDEQRVLRQWAEEFGVQSQIFGTEKPYAVAITCVKAGPE